jgi:hypothetical protein
VDNLITGLIFACNDYITSTQIFYKPDIISLTTIANGAAMEQYSFQSNPNLTATINHRFVERCGEIDSVAPVYYITSVIWLVVSAVWIYLTYFRFKQHALYI